MHSLLSLLPDDCNNKILFHCGSESITYRHARGLIQKKMDLLSRYGHLHGKVVAIDALSSVETIISLLAVSGLGASTLLINHRLPSKEKHLLCVSCNAYLSFIDGQNFHHPSADTALTLPYLLLATSGSTAAPKIVALSAKQIYYSAAGTNISVGIKENSCIAMTLPFHHIGGIIPFFRAALAKASLLIPCNEPLRCILAKATVASVVPTQLYRLLKEGAPNCSHLQALILGGAAPSTELIQRAMLASLPIITTYGMTESCSMITMEKEKPEESSGRALAFREIAISEEGEILIRGKIVFSGYLKEGVITPAIDKEGWFSTKDIGNIDKEGKLHITGRKDWMFICGGENIHPETIEKHILDLPGVIAAAVCARHDEEWGQRPVAFVAFEGAEMDLEVLNKHLKKHLPSFVLPAKLLPLNEEHYAFGKIARGKLQQLLC